MARLIGYIVEVTFGIGIIQVDSWRHDTMDDTQNGDNSLDGSGCIKRMPQHRFGRTHGQLVGMVAKAGLNGLRLGSIVETSCCSMCINIVYLLGT